jgi:hypothetical protein
MPCNLLCIFYPAGISNTKSVIKNKLVPDGRGDNTNLKAANLRSSPDSNEKPASECNECGLVMDGGTSADSSNEIALLKFK